jgi:hypothetical protein
LRTVIIFARDTSRATSFCGGARYKMLCVHVCAVVFFAQSLADSDYFCTGHITCHFKPSQISKSISWLGM